MDNYLLDSNLVYRPDGLLFKINLFFKKNRTSKLFASDPTFWTLFVLICLGVSSTQAADHSKPMLRDRKLKHHAERIAHDAVAAAERIGGQRNQYRRPFIRS